MKGRPTAKFTVDREINDEGELTIVITTDTLATDELGTFVTDTANGTVALGKVVAELAKVATPETAAERKRNENIRLLVNAGLTQEAAEQAVANLS